MVLLQFSAATAHSALFAEGATSAASAASAEIMQGVTTAIVTVAVVFLVIVVIGFTLISRRRKLRGAGTPTAGSTAGSTGVPTAGPVGAPSLHDISSLANIALVKLDDTVSLTSDELGFAIAQFGEDRTTEFASALDTARSSLTEAFRLKQQLDDSIADSATKQREFNARIITLCEKAQENLAAKVAAFDALRRDEANAPAALKAARLLIVSTSMRVPAATLALATLTAAYSPAALAAIQGDVAEARVLLRSAGEAAIAADSRIAEPQESDPAAARVQQAFATAQHAAGLLDGIDLRAAALARDSARLEQLVILSRDDLLEATMARDAAPDPQTGGAIGTAITALEEVLEGAASEGAASAQRDRTDPAAAIDRIQHAVMLLDRALASARNQTDRLAHAHLAFAGVRVSAHSQIEATQSYIDSHRDAIGTDARTRLAEARRLLAVAEADADPVSALDTARSSATYARDADALARYNLQH